VDAAWLVNGLVQYVVLVFSMTVHEAAHAWWAMRNGDLTAYLGGQVSLDPIPHMRRSPIGMIAIPLITYVANGWMMGWASAPLSPLWVINNPRKAAAVSLAGPLANLSLAIIAGVAIRALLVSGSLDPSAIGALSASGAASGLAFVLWSFFLLNALLFAINMLPIPPLDGASAIGLLFDEATAHRLQMTVRQPMFAMLGFALFVMVGGRLAWPVVGLLQSLLFVGL